MEKIGLAVGDIAEMEKNASLERLVDLTEFFHRTEKALPAYFRRYCVLDKIVCIEKKKKDVGNSIYIATAVLL